MKNENTNKSHPFDLENQFDKRLKAYKKILQQQRAFCEKHGLKTATYVPPNKKDTNNENID